jgi:hypothetical protein
MATEPAPTNSAHQPSSPASLRGLLTIGGFWIIGILVGVFVAALSGYETPGPVNVAGLVVAAAATVVWGAVLAYHRRWAWTVASSPIGGLLMVSGVYAGLAAVDSMGDSAYPLLDWLIYSLVAAGALLIGTAFGIAVLLVVRRRSD